MYVFFFTMPNMQKKILEPTTIPVGTIADSLAWADVFY